MSETVLPVFTKEMKATHTILVPNMLPFHFALLRSALQSCGYKAEILQNTAQPDRRRLPCLQLYLPSAQGHGKSRARQCADYKP